MVSVRPTTNIEVSRSGEELGSSSSLSTSIGRRSLHRHSHFIQRSCPCQVCSLTCCISSMRISLGFSSQSSSNDGQISTSTRWSLTDFEQFFRSLEIVDYDLFVPSRTTGANELTNAADMSWAFLLFVHFITKTKHDEIVNWTSCSSDEEFVVRIDGDRQEKSVDVRSIELSKDDQYQQWPVVFQVNIQWLRIDWIWLLINAENTIDYQSMFSICISLRQQTVLDALFSINIDSFHLFLQRIQIKLRCHL